MKMYSDCSGECCICASGNFCLAGHGDDHFWLASKELIIENLDNDRYSSHTDLMIETLKNIYGYQYIKR
jgi:hypothetical protein